MKKEIKLNAYNIIIVILGLIVIATLSSPLLGNATLSDIIFGDGDYKEYSMICLLYFVAFMAGVVISVFNRFDISLLTFAVSVVLIQIASGNISNDHNIYVLFDWYLGGGTYLGWTVMSIHGTCGLIAIIVSVFKQIKNKSVKA